MVWWLAAGTFAAVSTVLLIAANVTSSRTSTSLNILLPVIIALSLISIFFQFKFRFKNWEDEEFFDDAETGATSGLSASAAETYQYSILKALDEKLRPSSITIIVVMAPSMALFWLLFLRLVAGEDHFQGHAALLDFGPLKGIPGGDLNISFHNGGDNTTLLNSLCGMFAAFCAFPAIPRVLAALRNGRGRKTIMGVFEVLASGLTFYPSAYTVIAYLLSNDDTFATSKFVSNAFEWALGYCVGVSAGFFVTALVEVGLLGNIQNEAPEDEETKVYGTGKIALLAALKIVHFMFGILFVFAVFASAILFGYTWNTCENNATDCVNYSSKGQFSALVGSMFVVLPVVFIAAAALREKKRP